MQRSASCFACQSRERSEWCSLGEPELRVLDQNKICNTYEPGQVIFYEGNACLGIHCIEAGTVALRKASGDGDSVIVGLLGPGETLGYSAYFSQRGYGATAEALTACRVCFIDRAAVRTLLQQNPSLGLRFLTRAAADLEHSEQERVLALALPLRARLAHLLLVLKDRAATVDEDGNITVDLPLPRRDMAAMLGARPESLSRAIRQFEDEGIARFGSREVLVPDLDALIDEVEGRQGDGAREAGG